LGFVKRRRAQLGVTLLLFAEQKTLRKRRTLVGYVRLVTDQRDRLLVSLGAQGRSGLESALPSANDDDGHLFIAPLLLRRRRVDYQAVERRRDV
jgi:hypothetical protein